MRHITLVPSKPKDYNGSFCPVFSHFSVSVYESRQSLHEKGTRTLRYHTAVVGVATLAMIHLYGTKMIDEL